LKPFVIDTTEPAEGPAKIVEIKISGFLDAHTVVTFERTMDGLLERQYNKFIIDLESLNYISSAGIGALMVFLQQLRRCQGDMVIFRPPHKVMKIFELLGFNQIFNITDDYHAALQALG
jgi:anti-sigma B factor antagonist